MVKKYMHSPPFEEVSANRRRCFKLASFPAFRQVTSCEVRRIVANSTDYVKSKRDPALTRAVGFVFWF